MYYVEKRETKKRREREREREREEKDRHNVLKYFDIISHNTHAYAVFSSPHNTREEGKKKVLHIFPSLPTTTCLSRLFFIFSYSLHL